MCERFSLIFSEKKKTHTNCQKTYFTLCPFVAVHELFMSKESPLRAHTPYPNCHLRLFLLGKVEQEAIKHSTEQSIVFARATHVVGTLK